MNTFVILVSYSLGLWAFTAGDDLSLQQTDLETQTIVY